ncbi:hypothetical protein [Actinocatenispora comari]|nr:hypothetical protein [Actinocatenispora comari]
MVKRAPRDDSSDKRYSVETFCQFYRHAALGNAETLPNAAKSLLKRGVEPGPALTELAGIDSWALRTASPQVRQHAIDLYYQAIQELGATVPDPRATRLAEARRALQIPDLMAGSYTLESLNRLLPDDMAAIQPLIHEWERAKAQYRSRFRAELDRIEARLDTLDGLDLAPPAPIET